MTKRPPRGPADPRYPDPKTARRIAALMTRGATRAEAEASVSKRIAVECAGTCLDFDPGPLFTVLVKTGDLRATLNTLHAHDNPELQEFLG